MRVSMATSCGRGFPTKSVRMAITGTVHFSSDKLLLLRPATFRLVSAHNRSVQRCAAVEFSSPGVNHFECAAAVSPSLLSLPTRRKSWPGEKTPYIFYKQTAPSS
jgi:hypothetical protein